MKKIQMVDLTGQYTRMKEEMDEALLRVVGSGQYINGEEVFSFAEALKKYTGAKHVIPCGNGTDALQISLMALNFKPGDEIIVPAFTYAAAAEAIVLLGLTPVMVDVDPSTFTINPESMLRAISPKTKAVIPVHLFGQTSDMASIKKICDAKGIGIIEDNAQSIGSVYTFPDGSRQQAGTIGTTGTLSFFPTKNLGCYGDGGAILTDNDDLAKTMRMITQHGQSKKYHHDIIGCNSRLDALQAAILKVKLKRLSRFAEARQQAAAYYNDELSGLSGFITTPATASYSSHVYHQYTICVKGGKRDSLQNFLKEHDIPSVVYYPVPLHKQVAFGRFAQTDETFDVTLDLCSSVLSLPMHTELDIEQQHYIVQTIKRYFL